MQRPTKRTALFAGAAAVTAGAIAVPVIALAGTTTHVSTTLASSSLAAATTPTHRAPMGGPGGPGGMGPRDAAYDAAVAKQLGISTSTFEAAEQAVRASMKPPTPPTTPPTTPPSPASRLAHREAMRTAEQTALAAKLKITVTQLTAAEDAATQQLIIARLPQLVSRGVMTQAEANALTAAAKDGTFTSVYRAQLIARMTTRLDKAVANGRLTKAEEAQILSDLQTLPISELGFGGMGGPRGHGGGPGGPMGGPGRFGATGATGAGGGTPPSGYGTPSTSSNSAA